MAFAAILRRFIRYRDHQDNKVQTAAMEFLVVRLENDPEDGFERLAVMELERLEEEEELIDTRMHGML